MKEPNLFQLGFEAYIIVVFFHTINTCSDLDNDNFPFSEDCNDNNPNIHPNAPEICNSIDDNCNGLINDGIPTFTFFADNDNDSFGDADVSLDTCSNIPPSGFVANSLDCNDNNPNIHPNAPEICNSIDDNCNGLINDGIPTFTFFADNDNDSFGDADISLDTCSNIPPTGFVTNSLDCNDNNPNIHPNAPEICNSIDDNCNGLINDGIPTFTFFADNDNDSFGDADVSLDTCSNIPPSGFVANSLDCNDNNPNIHPNAPEICNSIDDNCNGLINDGIPTFTFLQIMIMIRLEMPIFHWTLVAIFLQLGL